MPNHCENIIIIKGPEKSIKEIIKKYSRTAHEEFPKEKILSFEKILPTPKELYECNKITGKKTDHSLKREKETNEEHKKRLEKLKKKYGNSDWYWWRVNNWGTKWDTYNLLYFDQEKELLTFEYSTAWAPGDKILLELSKKIPDVEIEIEYFEPGCCFCGKSKFKAGETIERFYTEDIDKIKEIYPQHFEDEEEEKEKKITKW